MTSEQWQRVKVLFEEALECVPTERSAFLAKACIDDELVRQEVESLLVAHEDDLTFMNEPVGNLILSDKPVLTTGQRFGHYDEISLLGEGGMGQVYLAVDTRLGRKVALKLLPTSYKDDADRSLRLEQEARAASALNHPNIVTIHEIGETDSVHFMATEFVDGETLRVHITSARMTVGEVLEVAGQIASALQAAHEAGIVHRDIKPENIMVRRDGVVKVLDFGLAKLTPQTGSQPAIKSVVQTHAGVIVGTVAYMSPEQARGQSLDPRTDVWSLGVVLYELVTGRAPFIGDKPSAVITSITDDDPPPLNDAETPAELGRIITKALKKEKTQRYQTAGELASDLKNLKEELTLEARLKEFRGSAPGIVEEYGGRHSAFDTAHESTKSTSALAHSPTAIPTRLEGWARQHKAIALAAALLISITLMGGAYVWFLNRTRNTSTGGKKTIALLPLKPIDPSKRNEVYEIALAESLIHRIGLSDGVSVRRVTATQPYQNVALDPVAAGKELQVEYVLSASYLLASDRIRITAQLINVSTGAIENTYQTEAATADMFAMQDTIANELGNKLLTQFGATSTRRSAYRGTSNEEAYRLYLQGIYLANNRNLADGKKAIEVLEKAVALDPNYARAWAGLAYAHRTLSLWTSGVTSQETYQKSIDAINRALALDEKLSEAHSALCENKYLYEWDFQGAERECKRAIELDPGSGQAHEIYSRFLMGRGRLDEAIAEIRTAIDIEPSSRFFQRNYGRALFYSRRYPEASTQFKRVLEMDEHFGGTYSWITSSYALGGNDSEAFEWFKRMLANQRANDETVKTFQKVFESGGWRGVLREWLNQFEKIGGNNFDRALYNAQVGNKDEALSLLETMYQQREIWMTYLQVDPRLDPLRDDPRFTDLVKRVDTK